MEELNLLTKEEIKEVINHPEVLISVLFKDEEGKPLKLTDYQLDLVKSILLKRPKRVLLWAATRAGKSYAVAFGVMLAALISPGEKIRVIGPTAFHSRIIMDYILDHLADDDVIIDSLTEARGRTAEKLREELSKSRITYKNSSEISILSASIKSKGMQLLGRGGSIVIVDECEQIPEEIVRTRIMRMVGEREEAQVILISNPTDRGYMYSMRDNPEWTNLIVGWEAAVKAKRISLKFIKEMRKSLTPSEFDIWYNAVYPDDVEGSLLRYSWIERAVANNFNLKKGKILYGLDVAEAGEDLSVLTKIMVKGGIFKVLNVESWHKADTMATVGKVVERITDKKSKIMVDSVGVGKGVYDRLKEKRYNVRPVKAGERPKREVNRFINDKARIYWNLRTLFEEDRIDIPDLKKLRDNLSKMKYDLTSASKIRIIDPTKSPDFADSLSYGCSGNFPYGETKVLTGDIDSLFPKAQNFPTRFF